MGSGRYFGFVIGGALPASLAVDWLVSTWDQNTGLAEPTPATSALEAVAGRWVLELLGLPSDSSFAFVTGCQMAHVTCLAAARHAVYRRAGWDLPEKGLAGAPPLRVVVGGERHVTVERALRLLGIGRAQEVVLPADAAGADGRLERSPGRSTTRRAHDRVRPGWRGEHRSVRRPRRGSSRSRTSTAPGSTSTARSASGPRPAPRSPISSAATHRADSWATDAHKWLNVPYDCGIAICAHPATTRRRWSTPRRISTSRSAGERATRWATARSSRAARGRLPVWAAIRELGRAGRRGARRADVRARAPYRRGPAALPGCEVLNDVVLNQVLFRFATTSGPPRSLAAVQARARPG